ncbi:MAG: cysteine desulfurase family protein, partial [Phycisphaeraceae bacterium]
VDLLTLAGHKFHGPKATGALYIRTGVRLRPVQRGGPQERERRGGTENVPGIIGLGVAARLARDFLADAERVESLRALRDGFERDMLERVEGSAVNAGGPDVPRLWNTSNLAFPGLEAEAILVGLSEKGVCASAGAACSSGSLEPSPVLLAMGYDEPRAHGSVRFSLSRHTSQDELDHAAAITADVVTKLRKTMPVG